jgi:hypothetical protein
VGAQQCFQNTVFYPGGASFATVSVTDNAAPAVVTGPATLPNGAAFNWSNIYGNYTGVQFIVVFDTVNINVRKVLSIANNTTLIVTEPFSFTNSASKFMISPVATVESLDTNSPLGKRTEFMRLTYSNANSSVRFVNNCIESMTSSGGTGYNNTDVLYITGFQNIPNKVTGGYVAVANIQTGAGGTITNIFMSNIGCGFTNTATIIAVVANSSSNNRASNTSAGSGATFTYNIGATLRTELTPNVFRNCKLVNLDVNDCHPFFDVSNPPGTTFALNLRCAYYLINDPATDNGYAYYVYSGGQWFSNLPLMKRTRLIADKVPVFMSYSNEFNTYYPGGSGPINDQVNALTFTSNNFVLQAHTTSNNDYIIVNVDTNPVIEFGKYIINNDYTNEQTNFGNCWAKHLTTMTNFAQLAEDIRVYIDAYKPSNTDIQVYARIQNSGDPEAFDDEDWTRLQLINGIGMTSSLSDETDYVELTYGFQGYPNVAFTVAGLVTTSNGSANIVGPNTTWASSLNVHDMIRIYDPLFPDLNFVVATVNQVSGANVVLDTVISSNLNPALVQSSYSYYVDKIGFENQGFNNIVFENVVRYYNSSIVKYDGYDTLQIKVCLLSSHLTHNPEIRDIRATAISA